MTTSTQTKPQNSMAAGLSAAMNVIMWLSIVIFILAGILLISALPAGLHSGEISFLGMTIEVDEDVSPAQIAGGLAMLCVVMPGIIYICYQLRRILRTLADGDPFVSENSGRLTKIAGAIALMEIGRMIAIICVINLVAFDPPESAPAFTISLVAWAAAVAFFVLAQVFREGTRLRDDAKMTI